jgi:glycosyltransferase involved in cell wall biosynthesis
VETYVRDIVEHTRTITKKRDVRVVTSKLRTHGPLSELNPESLMDDPIYVQRLHHAATPFISYPRLQALPYYLAHHAPDILHGHGFWYHPADASARFARRHAIPFILHPYYYEHGVRRKAIWQTYKHTIGRRTFAAADIVVVISPFEQQLIRAAGFPVKQFELIPPGVNVDQLSQAHPDPYARRGIKGEILLAVGRLAPGKGHDELISALPELVKARPTIQLVIIGEDFGTGKQLQKRAQKLGLSSKLHLLGKVPTDELMGAYQHATLFIHPSHYEAFGIVLAESLGSGTPVVARSASAIPYVVPHQKGGILFETHGELIRAVGDLLQDKERRTRLARQGREHVVKSFNIETTAKKIADLYQKLAPASSREHRR